METASSFVQLATSRVAGIPETDQGPWRQLIKAVDGGNAKLVELAVAKITDSDAFQNPPSREATVAMAQVLLIALREAYSAPRSGQFEIYTSLLPVFTGFLGRNAKAPELRDAPKVLLSTGEQFAVAFFDHQSRSTVYFDNFYEFQLQNVRDFLGSPGFRAWRGQDGVEPWLRGCLARWLVHLADFARNRREKAFLNLLDTALHLLRTIPELLSCFDSLPKLLPAAKKSFHFLYAEGEDNIARLLAKARKAANADLQPVIGEWIELYSIGSLPEVPRSAETEESPSLTVPFVYRAMLEEVLGDGTISTEEEWVIKNMRDFVEIPSDRYNRIFEQVLEGRRLRQVPVLDRDFSPREFLLKILLKTFDDGVVTDEEKAIIGKVANALTLSREVLTEVFDAAKAQIRSGGGPKTDTGSQRELDRLHDLVRYTAMEERMRSVLVSDRGMKIYNKAGKFLAGLRPQAREQAGEKAAELLGQWPVACCFFEPQVYLYPVIMLFIDSLDVHPTRLEFKGGRIDVEIVADLTGRRGEDTWLTEDLPLRLFNDSADVEIPLKALLVGDSIQNFIEGCDETRGKYAVMVMHHARMAPVLALQKAGGLDFTGQLAGAVAEAKAGRIGDAVTLLKALAATHPDRFEIHYQLGNTYAQLAATGDATAWQLAFDAYKTELGLNPSCDKAMRATGQLYAQQQRWDEALFWFNQACQCAPGSLVNLTTLTEACWRRDLARNTTFDGPPDYVTRQLGEAFHLMPTHPRVVRLITEIGGRLQLDLTTHLRALPVPTLFQ